MCGFAPMCYLFSLSVQQGKFSFVLILDLKEHGSKMVKIFYIFDRAYFQHANYYELRPKSEARPKIIATVN